MWELDHKEGCEPKNWFFWIVVLEKTLESSLDCKNTKPVNPKGNQPWIFLGRTDLKLQYFCHLMGRASSLEKTLMLGKIDARGEGGGQRWDSYIASLTQWTWIWANSRGFVGVKNPDSKESACNAGPTFYPWVGKIPWKRAWQPALVFLPGEFRGQKSLTGYSSWCQELDLTECLSTQPTRGVKEGRPGAAVQGVAKNQAWPSNWTTTTKDYWTGCNRTGRTKIMGIVGTLLDV